MNVIGAAIEFYGEIAEERALTFGGYPAICLQVGKHVVIAEVDDSGGPELTVYTLQQFMARYFLAQEYIDEKDTDNKAEAWFESMPPEVAGENYRH